ncbi:DUF2878 domain-containing protein [Aliiglaciecola sp. CAU 1673]|uniref:DUF2878 domain-containing protein n=1 Tax=Aliiglaciecola sp. CAU 1673 TaxID=3032595 RepID=UPI0023DCC4B7|nr:DUF2878 domain-containing protein [Aliiglaciecola sp. CAU 1673]MDF2178211.1 DUF2878 domain-containing protein [Aliiglaciecola sp. CAU 1673]
MRFIAANRWFNAAWFQCFWFLAILGKTTMLPALAALLLLHVVLHSQPMSELRMMIMGAGFGLLIDGLLTNMGIFVFEPAISVVIPLWLLGLWIAFCATLRNSLSFLLNKPLLGLVLGSITGPMSYLAGMKLGAVTFGLPMLHTLLIISAIWALLMPTLAFLSKHIMKPERECIA